MFEMISIRFLLSRMCFARILATARDSSEPIAKSSSFTNCRLQRGRSPLHQSSRTILRGGGKEFFPSWPTGSILTIMAFFSWEQTLTNTV